MTDTDRNGPITSAMNLLIVATVALYLILAGVGVYAYLNAQSNRQALCALRHRYEVSVVSGNAFFKDHPHGTQDFPPSLIRNSIREDESFVKALSGLDCN